MRRHIAATPGVDGCYVGEVDGAGPAFMHHLFTAHDNSRLRSHFGALFSVLAEDEAMEVFLDVAPAARSPGLIVGCVREVTAEAHRRGAASVISFINPTNKGALFVNHLAGFQALVDDGHVPPSVMQRSASRPVTQGPAAHGPWPTLLPFGHFVTDSRRPEVWRGGPVGKRGCALRKRVLQGQRKPTARCVGRPNPTDSLVLTEQRDA